MSTNNFSNIASNTPYDNTENHREKSIGFGFNISNYIDNLTPAKSKGKYICPSCGGNNLSINPRNGAYKCYNGCENKDIREAIAPRRSRDEFKPDEFDRKIAQKRLRKEKEERELKLKAEKLAKSLSPIERHTEHGKILSQLTLSDEHRDYLVNRLGFPLEALERCRTVEPKQPLTVAIDKRLAGVNPFSGMALTNGEKGILVAFPDADGYLVAMKLYNPDAKKTGGPKSKWLSSDWFNIGSSPKLSNGEQSIAVYYPETIKDPTKIGLCEGVEWKAQEAANRLGYPVIGFSGISFLNLSPKTTKAAIATIQAKTGINNDVELVFILDGGLVQNAANIKIVQDFIGYSTHKCVIAWWGQTDKSQNDIDEITQEKIDSIQYLTPDEFLDIASKEQWKAQCWKAWKKSKQFTPDIITNTRYFSYPVAQHAKTIELIKGGLGGGKSTQLREQLLKYWKEKGVLSLGYRNLLLLQFGEHEQLEGYNFTHIHHHSSNVYFADPSLWLTSCIDSILKIPLATFDNKLLILDEIVSILKHLLFSSTVKNRTLVIKHFFEAVRRCDRVVGLDGNMADWVGDFFQGINSGKQIVKIENQYETPKAPLTILLGTVEDDERLCPNDRSPLFKQLLAEVEPTAACADSQILLESFDKRLTAQGKKVLRIDSKTVTDKTLNITQILKRGINRYLRENNIDVLLYSPSAESGLDVSITDYFKSHYSFFYGVLDVDSSLQMLERIRDIKCPKYIWIRNYSIVDEPNESKSYDAEILAWYQNQSLTRDLHSVMTGEVDGLETISNILKIVQDSHGPDSKTANQLQAIRNFERANFRECFTRMLTMKGYVFDEVTCNKNDPANFVAKEEIKAATNQVKDQNTHDIFTASDQFIGRTHIVLRFDADWATRCALEKARWIDRLPGIEKTEVWTESLIRLIKYDKPSLVPSLERYYLASNLDKARLLSIARYRKMNESAIAASTVCSWQLKNEYSTVKASVDIGILNLLEHPEEAFTVDHPMIKAILSKAQTKPIQHALKEKVGKNPMKFIGNQVRLFGGTWQRVTEKINGKTSHHYRVNHLLQSPIAKEILLAQEILLAIEKKIDREILKNNADFSQKNNCQNNDFSSSETESEKDFEQVPLCTPFSINSTPEVEPLTNPDSFISINVKTDLMVTENDPFAKYQVGDRVSLWHPFSQSWQPATVKRVVSGVTGFVYVLADNGLGDSITRQKLSHLVHQNDVREAT